MFRVPLPTRALDLRPPDGSSGLRLHPSEGERAPYATLSYCWGIAQPMMTTEARYPLYLQAIDEHALPKTIQDAIKVTREVGLRFLWVDSLCIIQDSPLDKSHEISRMQHVFRHSYLTILAASAPNANFGFLKRVLAPPSQYYGFPYLCPDGRIGEVVLRRWTPALDHNPADDPVNTRAWIFQERLLSRRLLIYQSAPHPIQWQCRTVQLVSGGPLPQLSQTGYGLLPAEFFLPATLTALQLSSDPIAATNDLWPLWASLVQAYSRRALTSPTDRLPAIAGLASSIHGLLLARGVGTTYMAGLWSHELVKSLLWFAWPESPPSTEPMDKYRDVSVDEEIRSYGEDGSDERGDETFKRVEEVKVEALGPSWSWASTPAGLQVNHALTTVRKADTHPLFRFLGCNLQDNAVASLSLGKDESLVDNGSSRSNIELQVPYFGYTKAGVLTLTGAAKDAIWIVRRKKLVDVKEWTHLSTDDENEDIIITSPADAEPDERNTREETGAVNENASLSTEVLLSLRVPQPPEKSPPNRFSPSRPSPEYSYIGSTLIDDQETLYALPNERPVLCLLLLNPDAYEGYFYVGLVLEEVRNDSGSKIDSARKTSSISRLATRLHIADDGGIGDQELISEACGDSVNSVSLSSLASWKRYRRVGLFRVERKGWFDDCVEATRVEII